MKAFSPRVAFCEINVNLGVQINSSKSHMEQQFLVERAHSKIKLGPSCCTCYQTESKLGTLKIMC